MKTIWKYELSIDAKNHLNIPEDGKILHLKLQNGIPCLWILVEQENLFEERKFLFYGTGMTISKIEELTYIGSVLIQDETLVFHLFEEKN